MPIIVSGSIVPNVTHNIDMHDHSITNLAEPANLKDATTKGYVDSSVQGLDWQDSVLDIITTPPASPSAGDRYIVGVGGTGAFSGHDNDIAQWNGTTWDFTSPNKGFACYIESLGSEEVFNGTGWVKFGATIQHNNLLGLQGGTNDEMYHLTSAQSSLIANATSSATVNTLVLRDASGNISFNTATGTATHALEADKWTMPRTITLTGDVTGSATIDGSSDVTLTETVNHASEANKWTNPIALSLTGAVSGSALIDGSTNISLDTTITTSQTTVLYLDDSTMSTTATNPVIIKSLRYYNSGNIDKVIAHLSAWNTSSGATTTIGINIDSASASSTTVNSTNETFVDLSLNAPATTGVHTLNITLGTSNTSYAAYTKFLQVEVS